MVLRRPTLRHLANDSDLWMRGTKSSTRASTSSTSAASTRHSTTRSSPWTNSPTAPLTWNQFRTPSNSQAWYKTLEERPSPTGYKACSYQQQTAISWMALHTRLASVAIALTAARSRGTPSCHSCATKGKVHSSNSLNSMTQRTRLSRKMISAYVRSLINSVIVKPRHFSLANMVPWPPRNKTFISSRSLSTRIKSLEPHPEARVSYILVRRPHRSNLWLSSSGRRKSN